MNSGRKLNMMNGHMNVRILIVSVECHPKAGLGASASRVVLSPRGALKAVDSLTRLRLDESSTFQKVIAPSYFILPLSVGWVSKVDHPIHWSLVFQSFSTEFCPA